MADIVSKRVDMMDPQVREQIEWERSSVDRGVERYRQSLSKTKPDGSVELRALGDVEPGQRIIRDLLPQVTYAIQQKQMEAAEGIAKGGTGNWSHWWWPIISIPADEMAFIALKTVLSVPAKAHGRPVRSLALDIARHIKNQFEFNMWKEAEKKHAKETGELDYWKLMLHRVDKVDERAFKKFAKRSGRLDPVTWDMKVRLHLGTTVLSTLVENSGGWFEMGMQQTKWGRGMTREVLVTLTDLGKTWVEERHAYNELVRPWLIPMLAPPLDWVEADDIVCEDYEQHEEDMTHESDD